MQLGREKVSRSLAIGLMLVTTQAFAVECGPIMRAVTIHQMEETIREADARMTQHGEALRSESTRLLAAATSDVQLQQIDKLLIEIDLINNATVSSERVQHLLSTGWQLALIRDKMVDARDKAMLSGHLSIQLAGTRPLAEKTSQYISSLLTRLTRPGVAVDLSKLRDSVELVVKNLAKCTPPSQGSNAKPG